MSTTFSTNIETFAAELAGFLFWEVSKVSPWGVVTLTNPDNHEAILVREDAQTHRIVVAGIYPRNHQGALARVGDPVSITVAPTCTPERLAKEITRRLLTSYRENLAKVLDANAAELQRDQAAQANLERLAEAAGVAGVRLDRRDRDNHRLSLSTKAGFGRVDVRANAADVDLRNLPVDLAEQILTLIADHAQAASAV